MDSNIINHTKKYYLHTKILFVMKLFSILSFKRIELTVWKHGGRGKITTLHVPKISKEIIHKIGIVLDHNVINNPDYDKGLVLAKIEKLLP
ncbi:hypothetical protein PN36_32960 [Candidatus Thiomargarita nelsonii]|uniref:Uncharacterized protein n=1 Tax=Candidatus Thiomargarita nelsonii TaxID=1003181 RepID=A0A0A6P320_9GAMM|nr:hypothetical protein PN36_32960 [Candidatus Thiomargarita nelsonii]